MARDRKERPGLAGGPGGAARPKRKGWELALWAHPVIQHSLSAYCIQSM